MHKNLRAFSVFVSLLKNGFSHVPDQMFVDECSRGSDFK